MSIIHLSLLCALLLAVSVTGAFAFEGNVDLYRQKQPSVEIYLDAQDGEIEPLRNVQLHPPIRLIAPPQAVQGRAPEVVPPDAQPAAAHKQLLKPFFTAHADMQKPAPKVKASPKAAPGKSPDTAAPPAEMTDKPQTQPQLAAAVPPHDDMTIVFDKNSSQLSSQAEKYLDSIVAQLNELQDMRLQIRAYASGDEGGQSGARRMALSRGLMARSYLTDRAIKPTRLDVRALGSETDKTPVDRVDLVFVR